MKQCRASQATNFMNDTDLERRIRKSISRNPDHKNHEIAKNITGANTLMVQRIRESIGDNMRDSKGELINLGEKLVLDHRPPETVLKYLRKIPLGKAETLEDFAKRIGRSKDKVRQDAKSHGCCKWVDRGNEDWELVVMHPDTAKHYND
jgi:O6-methylguanine-DNA--protein-cysteine methyltransferase